MYNTTENLILAIAYDLYGNDTNEIQLYIKSRSKKTDTSLWSKNLEQIQEEAKLNGYSSLIEFCEDVRYTKLIEMYNEKIKMRQEILENKIDPRIYLETIPEEYLNIDENAVTEYQDSTHLFDDETDTSMLDPKLKLKEMQENMQKCVSPENITVDGKNDIENKIIKDKEDLPKYEKRYYLKMNENERQFDDFLDNIEDSFAPNSNESPTNDIAEVFPALGKVKNIEERRKLIGKKITKEKKVTIEVKKHYDEEAPVKRYKTLVTLEDQYKTIMEKIYGRKREEKDKTKWAEELKTIAKVMQVKVEGGAQKDTNEVKLSLKNIANDLTLECSMAGTILKMLMVIQEAFFGLEDRTKMRIILEFKKLLCYFFDFYRK